MFKVRIFFPQNYVKYKRSYVLIIQTYVNRNKMTYQTGIHNFIISTDKNRVFSVAFIEEQKILTEYFEYK